MIGKTRRSGICLKVPIDGQVCNTGSGSNELRCSVIPYRFELQVCIIINNIEHVRRALRPLQEELEFDKILAAVEKVDSDLASDRCRAAFYAELHTAEDEVIHKILTIIAGLTEKVRTSYTMLRLPRC